MTLGLLLGLLFKSYNPMIDLIIDQFVIIDHLGILN